MGSQRRRNKQAVKKRGRGVIPRYKKKGKKTGAVGFGFPDFSSDGQRNEGVQNKTCLPPPLRSSADAKTLRISANEFVVRDDEGRRRAALGCRENAVALSMYDRSGNPRADLWVDDNTDLPALMLYTASEGDEADNGKPKGVPRVGLVFSRDEKDASNTPLASVVLFGRNGEYQTLLIAEPDGCSHLVFLGADGKAPLWSFDSDRGVVKHDEGSSAKGSGTSETSEVERITRLLRTGDIGESDVILRVTSVYDGLLI